MIVLEVVKTLQTVLLSFEEGYAVGEEKSKFLSLKLHENLGNIKYIFTDKTGTLTKNEMEFKGCSIFTRLYAQNENNITLYDTAIDTTTITKQRTIFSKDFNVQGLKESLLNDEYLEINSESKECYYKTLNEVTLDFFMNIALNHNVLVNVDDNNSNNSSEISKSMYSGSNPDETVLVQAAKELEVEFVERIGNDITIRIGGKCLIHYEMLYRFDFTSERKRSSIIVRCPDGVIKLFMKGADSVILQKINHFSKMNLFTKTCEHIDKFAKEGLRTLCFSVKILTENEFKEFELQYQQLQAQCLVNKDKVSDVEKLISELESNMLLLGVTALEDMLQDNVKGAIKEFIEANINVWMLTGDKMDTAESIGYSCRLLMEDTEVFKIRDKDINNIEQVLKDIKQEIDDGLLNSAKILNGNNNDICKDKSKEDIEGNNNVNNRFNSETKILHECNINNNTINNNNTEESIKSPVGSPGEQDYFNTSQNDSD
jgi:magnesium-transporting ATPase (P-type)